MWFNTMRVDLSRDLSHNEFMAGRPRKYPIHILNVGECITIPWIMDKSGRMPGDQRPIHDAIKQERRRFGKKFDVKPDYKGLIVTRLE